MASNETNRYNKLVESIFLEKYKKGKTLISFERNEIEKKANELKIKLPKNLGDIIYSFKYRTNLPKAICNTAPKGKEWVIKNVGRAKYNFELVKNARILPDNLLVEIKIPDSTPNIVNKYAFTDEQALLTKLRYNRLLDTFTGVTCYSLQNHLRTTVPQIGQIETDEIYIGVNKNGSQFVFPIQAKGGKDEIGIVQIEQDIEMCKHKYPDLLCRAIAAQFIEHNLIAIFEFKVLDDEIKKVQEKHYRLVEYDKISGKELQFYNSFEND